MRESLRVGGSVFGLCNVVGKILRPGRTISIRWTTLSTSSVSCKHHVFAQSSLCKIYFFLRLSRDSGGFGVLLSDDVPGCDRKGVSSDITT
jgi:hypothetical protein